MLRDRPTGVRRLIVEAVANAIARPALSLGLILTTTALITGSAIAEINATTSTLNYERELIDGGYSTLLIDQDNPAGNTLSTDTCTVLATIAGVQASVAMREPQPFTLWTIDGPDVPLRTVSADIIEFLRHANPTTATRWFGAQTFVDIDSPAASPTATQYKLRVVDNVGVAAATDAMAVTLTALGGGSSGNIITIDPTSGSVAACALFVDTPARDHVNRSIEAALPVLEGFSQRWALPSAERFETPEHRFESRPSQYYWAIATLAFIATAMLHLRLRRSDHALYAIAGLDQRRIWMLATLETFAILATAIALATITVALATHDHQLPAGTTQVGWATIQRAGIATTLTTLALTRAAAKRTTSSTLDAIKDR